MDIGEQISHSGGTNLGCLASWAGLVVAENATYPSGGGLTRRGPGGGRFVEEATATEPRRSGRH